MAVMAQSSQVYTGSLATIRCSNTGKGFGFIDCDDGSGEIYVRHYAIKIPGTFNSFENLNIGDKVKFEIGIQEDGRRRAINVSLIRFPEGHNEPGSQNISPLNAETLAELDQSTLYTDSLQKHMEEIEALKAQFMSQYIKAINAGYHTFWCIPSVDTDEYSNYIAFLLGKSKKNIPLLEEAKKMAHNICNDIIFAKIREWPGSQKQVGTYYKAKGLLFDCKNSQYSFQLYSKLINNLLPRAIVGRGYSTNFCRFVLKEFGEAFIRIQSSKNCPKLPKKIRDTPQGPKINYVMIGDGEPSNSTVSISTMNEFEQNADNKENDHQDIEDLNSNENVSDESNQIIIEELKQKIEEMNDETEKLKLKVGNLQDELESLKEFTVNIDILDEQQLDALQLKLQHRINLIKDAKDILIENQLYCMICLKNKKNIVINGCHHFCLCDKCEENLNPKICPRCQTPFSSVIKIGM
eukprot:495823_1